MIDPCQFPVVAPSAQLLADVTPRYSHRAERLLLQQRLCPDLLHANQHAFGVLSDEFPVLVVSHSDVLSW